jgi:uncharacterized membrane protein
MRTKINTDRGVAGLTVLLSLITMLFVIGLIVMIFSLMGGELINATYDSTASTVLGENVVEADFVDGTGFTLLETDLNSGSWTITALYNDSVLQTVGNYTLTGNVLANATTFEGATDMTVNYTYNYDATNDATNVMNGTVSGISGVTGWFSIFIVISAMVVLILLTVIIITAIRGSGLMGGSA